MIKKRALESHMRKEGGQLIRQGAKHEVWQGPSGRATVPRHRELPVSTARAICSQLGISRIP